jgi:hypothetical protein
VAIFALHDRIVLAEDRRAAAQNAASRPGASALDVPFGLAAYSLVRIRNLAEATE